MVIINTTSLNTHGVRHIHSFAIGSNINGYFCEGTPYFGIFNFCRHGIVTGDNLHTFFESDFDFCFAIGFTCDYQSRFFAI
jgi:hypothetical protein